MTWGGLGSRGGHVIGSTRSGKPVYQRGGGTRGWSETDHHDAAGIHESAGNRATANAHHAAARAIREKRRHGGVLRRIGSAVRGVLDTGALQADLLRSRALLFGRGRPMRKGATFAAPGPAPGEHVLGKTKSGKPVYASGAKAGGYSNQDHADAATHHARAAAYHEKHAADHAKIRDTDRDWKRSEIHHGEHDRHAKLRDHHFERVQEHLAAGGHAEEADFDGKEILNRRPMDKKRVAQTKEDMRRRTHHDHPGGHDEADMAEYATYAAEKPPKKTVAA